MSDRIGSLRLDRNTTPEQLQAFLQTEGAITKVRAEANSDGSVTLFTTDRATGWWGEATGLSKERETARAALDLWFRFKFGPDLSPGARQVLDSRLGTGEVDVRAVRQLVGEARDLIRQQPRPTLPQPYRPILPRDGVKTADTLTLGGTKYALGEELGRGGLGIVDEGISDTGEKVAVKTAIRKDRAPEVEQEFRAHERAVGDGRGSSHIVGLKGAAVGPTGEIQAIVVEHMPGGDASNMLFRLRNAERSGLITPEQARLVRLTAAKDMATGLSQLHENRGMMHYDVKPGNFLISGTGVVKLSDFGTTRPEQEMHGEALSKSTTQVFMSPEVSRAPLRMAALNDEIRRLTTRADQRGFTKEALSDLARAQKAQNEIDTLSADRRGDVFSLGLSFVSAFEGKHLGGQYMQLWGRIEDLGTGSTSKRNAVLAELGVTSNSPEHQLIRAMLAGDPANRPTARDVANAQVFSDPRVGSPETRQLMLAVAQGKYDPPRNRGAL